MRGSEHLAHKPQTVEHPVWILHATEQLCLGLLSGAPGQKRGEKPEGLAPPWPSCCPRSLWFSNCKLVKLLLLSHIQACPKD